MDGKGDDRPPNQIFHSSASVGVDGRSGAGSSGAIKHFDTEGG
jgi:hypothetical protein